jgi:hypothetical protein
MPMLSSNPTPHETRAIHLWAAAGKMIAAIHERDRSADVTAWRNADDLLGTLRIAALDHEGLPWGQPSSEPGAGQGQEP